MEIFLFDKEKYERLYNCTLYEEGYFNHLKKPNRYVGAIYISAGLVYECLYIPCLIAMAGKRFRKLSCYKLMLFLGIIDTLTIPLNAILYGWFALHGNVFCDYPNLEYISGGLTTALWTAASMTCLILAFNRLCDLINPRLMILLFHGNRTYYWFIGPILYFFYFFFFTYPFVYTSANYAGFSNPYVGTVFEAQTNLQYFNLSLILHNIMVPVLMVLMYTIISAVVVVKSYRAKSATARLNSPALTKYQKSTIMQAFLICSVFIIAPIIYDWMNYYGAPWLMVVIGQVCWQSCHGIAVFIYISFNRALREKMMTFIQKPKVHTTSSGQHDDVFNRV
ncbi:unnamed protein product [Bursaphelenchus xylophilus]|uniref:(pine wood nematode) hypothetical protein n=1 Tax=Bursaphelenchus xylophilus TaxID=6326 RepID=A0A7I8X7T4_BURXY|nr:unnamed protein product [Bursaphelenchus xylophilus]CAG9125785.1 unnamed protein product [Bursaphelenchus xylophilus]